MNPKKNKGRKSRSKEKHITVYSNRKRCTSREEVFTELLRGARIVQSRFITNSLYDMSVVVIWVDVERIFDPPEYIRPPRSMKDARAEFEKEVLRYGLFDYFEDEIHRTGKLC